MEKEAVELLEERPVLREGVIEVYRNGPLPAHELEETLGIGNVESVMSPLVKLGALEEELREEEHVKERYYSSTEEGNYALKVALPEAIDRLEEEKSWIDEKLQEYEVLKKKLEGEE